MSMVDSYLGEVARFLPLERRDDVVEELRGAIEEQVADEVEAGSEATEATSRILRGFGHPLKVAGEYQTVKYLIGPELYPSFGQTLKLILIVVLAIQLAIALAAGQISDWHTGFFALFWQLANTAFWVFAIVTLVFVGIERSGERIDWYNNWDPAKLPRRGVSVIDRQDMVTNLLTEGVFLLWWNDVVSFASWLPSGVVVLELAEPWQALYWPLNVIAGVFFLLHGFVLLRGLWQRASLMTEIVLSCALAAALIQLTFEPMLVIPSTDLPDRVPLQFAVRLAVVVVIGFVVWDLVQAVRRYLR